MPTYQAPIQDVMYLLENVFPYESTVTQLPGFEEATLDVVRAVLEGAALFSREVLVPMNFTGDAQGCACTDGKVSTPTGYRAAYDIYRDGGWPGLAADPAYGGEGLPPSLALMVREFIGSGCMAFGMYGGLSQGAYRAIAAHANDEIKNRYLPKLASGEWTGTMCMTEAHAGSDLSTLRTRAEPNADGSYSLTGTKIFISGGDHDLTDNILHLVLARLPDAPAGTRGISLFLVPKKLVGPNGNLVANNVHCGSIEHKMGIRGSATATLIFEGAQGWLIGSAHGGMRAMFTMMNSSRVGVAVQSIGVAEISLQNAVAYAKERRQGRAPTGGDNDESAIIAHPDVRRNLLTMKAWVEGARAMYIDAAIKLDIVTRHPDPEARHATEKNLALLTPILKSFISEISVQVTDLGIQVFGGHGYICEHGMEQLLRDARIVPLYEGTNGIQALDLAHRKVIADSGKVVRAYIAELRTLAEKYRNNDEVGDLSRRLDEATGVLESATVSLIDHSSNPAAIACAATDYLRLFGLVALAAMWLRMAAAPVEKDTAAAQIRAAKLQTAKFYFARLLPEVEQRYRGILAGPETLLTQADDSF